MESFPGPEFRRLLTLPSVRVDLRYASANNFVGRDLYGDFREAYLHEVAFAKFARANEFLRERQPGWSFLVFDALRPRSVQRVLFAQVAGTDQEKYVAPPDKGSIHNFGFAIDLSLADERGHEVDMGSGFDDFRDLSQPALEDEFFRRGDLTSQHLANRQLLRSCMTDAGFLTIPHEWWHFEALPRADVRAAYRIIE